MGAIVLNNLTEARNRKTSEKQPIPDEVDEDIDEIKKQNAYQKPSITTHTKHKLACFSVTAMSIYTTFYKIWYPAQVVFDEVHFGKFAGFYLQRTYFFDVHPPLAKLMLAAVGYLIGFDGIYQFSNIGESYAKYHVPYIPFRAFPAFLNVLCVGLIYHILKESGYSVLTCFTVATLYLLDNGFIAQNRLILLDSILIFYMLASVYSYVRFRKLRHAPFTKGWWGWLICTGVSMSLTISVKMVGLFIFVAIGALVIKDIWDLLDIEKHGWSNRRIAQYFGAHAFGLILVPIAIYIFWFYVHFSILIYSGPGDHFMSNQFRDTLANSQIGLNSLDIMYNQSIRLQHKETQAFLHSNKLKYPKSYEDGRGSSTGLQITGMLKEDEASFWRIIPAYGEINNTNTPVKNNDIIRLVHPGTGWYLLTHDIAAPLMPTNQEFTLTSKAHRFNETLFRVELDKDKPNNNWSTLMKSVKLVHLKTHVALWCNDQKLPDWGKKQLEVNGNKKNKEFRNYWIATEILGVNATEINLEKNKGKKMVKMGFFEKFLELQFKMLDHNNKLSKAHPYQSQPHSWPLMLRGISYWADKDTKGQIYMTGNVVGWWTGLVCVFVFAGISILDKALVKRKTFIMSPTTRNRFNRTGGFFLLLWITHYLPFFIMGRTLYLHHYLPAMACNYLLIGSVFELLFVDSVNSPISCQSSDKKYSVSRSRTTIKSYIAAVILVSMQFMVYLFLSPMTYGTPGLTSEQAYRRKILDTWDVRYAKYISDM